MPSLPDKMKTLLILAKKKKLKKRNQTFSVVFNFTWKLELVSNILWMIVDYILDTAFLDIFQWCGYDLLRSLHLLHIFFTNLTFAKIFKIFMIFFSHNKRFMKLFFSYLEQYSLSFITSFKNLAIKVSYGLLYRSSAHISL